jgi:hypothetical protein
VIGLSLSRGLWIQAALIAALRAGAADRQRVYAAYVQLAARKHSHVTLDPDSLRGVLDASTDTLHEFDAVTDYIGSASADMVAHAKVTSTLLLDLWSRSDPDLKTQRATSLIVRKLLRRTDWATWLALVIAFIGGNSALLAYLNSWVVGHFLPLREVNEAFRQLTRPSRPERPSRSPDQTKQKGHRGSKS